MKIHPGNIYDTGRGMFRVIDIPQVQPAGAVAVLAETVTGKRLHMVVLPEYTLAGCCDMTALEIIDVAFWQAEQISAAHNFAGGASW